MKIMENRGWRLKSGMHFPTKALSRLYRGLSIEHWFKEMMVEGI